MTQTKIRVEALSYNALVGQCDLLDDILKEFDKSFWTGAFSVSRDIAQNYEALHNEVLCLKQQLQIELATRTLARIRTTLDIQRESFSYEDDPDEKGAE